MSSNIELDKCNNCGDCTPRELLEMKEGLCLNCHIGQWANDLKKFKNRTCFGTNNCHCSPQQGHCLLCKNKLVSIGSRRVNGAYHDDWDSRKYHKKCWKQIKNNDN